MAEVVNYNTILIELGKAVKMHNFYPQGHPNLDSALGKLYTLLKKQIDERGEIEWKVDIKGFYDGKVDLTAGNQELVNLAKKFAFRRVKEITFTPRLTQEDIRNLLSMLKLEPEELQAAGGPEVYIAGNDIKGILLNEMRYEDLLKIKKTLEEKREEEKREIAEDKREKEALMGESSEAAEKEPAPSKKPPQEDPLSSLLERIRKESDYLRYSDLLARIKDKTDILSSEKRPDEIFPVLLILLSHASSSSMLPTEIRQIALERLDWYLGDTETLNYLISKAGSKEEAHHTVIQRMLLRGKDKAVGLLLDALVEAPDAGTRRNLFNTVLIFGEKITPFVEHRLKSDKWYEIRQMVAILGEFASPASIDPLLSAFEHNSIKVKREVLKSLARIPSPRSTQFILNVVEEADPAVMTNAIMALGMLRDPSAVEPIAKIALKWEPFTDNQEPKKEAVKSLGIIGDKSAVPYLAKILLKNAWFGKKANEELRLLAANSLGMIGGEEAFKALEAACRNTGGELYITCKRILEGKEKKDI